mgnify:CR=1 FL=1
MKFNIWKDCPKVPITELLSFIVDNRGKTVPTADDGWKLIATNCVTNNTLFPVYEKVRYLTQETYETWFRAHPIPGDILFVNKGTPGRVCMVPDPVDFCIAQDMIALRADDEKIYNKYLFAVLRSREIQQQIYNTNVGDVIPHFKKQFMDQLLIPVPDRRIQEIIGNLYYELSYKTELNKKINENLEQQVSLLYQSWFEDFKITNGVCPENWSYQELSSIANIASGKRPPVKSDICNKETPISIVGAASVMGFTSEANHTDKILVTGRVGTHGVIQRFNTSCWTSDNTLVITSPYYEFTNQILHRIDYSSMNRGSTQPLITQGDMKKVVVLVPDENTLAKFEEFAGSLMAKWEANNNENVKLVSLRDTLLPKLMSGGLDVSGIDI